MQSIGTIMVTILDSYASLWPYNTVAKLVL